jgi:hypothetical protein
LNPNLESTMTEFWNSCEGQSVGPYLLQKHLGGVANSAVYAAVSTQDSQPIAIRLLRIDETERERRLSAWSALLPLSHPHLIKVFEVGQCEIDGVHLLYLAMERADGDLAGVLAERALTANEARETLLDPALQALTYLHERGYVFGGLEPSRFQAVNEEVKLASDCVTRSGQDGAVSPEDDVWSLGATLVHALTQIAPEPDPRGADPALPADLPEPFLTIARNCLRRDPKSRWSLAQIASHLRGTRYEVAPDAPTHADRRPRMSFYWILAAALTVSAILILFWRDRTAAPTVSQSTPAPVSPPVAAHPEPAQLTPKAAGDSGNWFVVVATYAKKEDAEKRARTIERQSPPFKAEVYAPSKSARRYYLVVVGSNLSKKAAVDLRAQVKRAGADAYITTFTP